MGILFKTQYQKFISLATALSLFLSFVTGPIYADIFMANTPQNNQIFSDFILPYSYGKITQVYSSNSDRIIINIQDLHCHPNVQKNISNIIEIFDKKYGVNKIYLEGAYGQVSTKWLTDKISNSQKEEILNKILETGRLTCAEYYSAKSGRTDIITGLEKKEPYLENIKRFGSIIESQEKINLILQAIEEDSQKLKKRYYTKRQFKLEALSKKFKEDKLSSQKYYAILSKHIEKLGIDLTKHENTLTYIMLLNLQNELNFAKITREMQYLIFILKDQIPYSLYKQLMDNTDNFSKTDKLYGYILNLCRQTNFDLSVNFKNLDKYFKYIELSRKINPLELIDEERKLTEEINTRFSETKAQRDIVFLTNFERYLIDYVTSKITAKDYTYYKENINTYRQLWNRYVDNRVLSMLDEYIAEADKFYQINTDRNLYFAETLFAAKQQKCTMYNVQCTINDKTANGKFLMSSLRGDLSTKQSTARSAVIPHSDAGSHSSASNLPILQSSNLPNLVEAKRIDIVITGGFHSQAVTEILKNHNVSYIVITPNVSDGIELAEQTYYQIAKEQSKISFQTIAPAIASVSPSLQKAIMDLIASPEQKKRMEKLNDKDRIKLMSDIAAAKILESDDLGALEYSLQRVVKDIVDDTYKEKVTPELISRIKNLQEVLNNKEQLQKVIDLLQESQAKQSVILISDIFDNLYKIFDSFIVSATEQLERKDAIANRKEAEDISKKAPEDDYPPVNSNLQKLQRRVVAASGYNGNILKWIRENKITNGKLLDRVYSGLKNLTTEEKQVYCKIIPLLKEEEYIYLFLAMEKESRNQYIEFYEYALDFNDYNDDICTIVLQELLDIIKNHGYTRNDFDKLYDYCNTRLIADLNTRENISNFLNLSVKIRSIISTFYDNAEFDYDTKLNPLNFKFILMLAKNFNYSTEEFNYLMKLICRSNLKEDKDYDKDFVKSFEEKKVNRYILQNFKYFEFYNKYVLDLLFSDFDETYINNFNFQKIIDLIDDLQKIYKIESLELENKGFSLVVFFSTSLEKYCKENNITDLSLQYQLAIRVARRIYAVAGDNIFTISNYDIEDIIRETLAYYKKIDTIISLIPLFDRQTAIFSIHHDEKNSDKKTQRFTPEGLEKIFDKLGIEPGYFEYIEISFVNKVLDFINTFDQDEIDKEILLDFLENTKGSVIVKETIRDYIIRNKKTALSKKSLIRYIKKIRYSETMVEANHFLGNIENFNSLGLERGVFVFDGHGFEDGISYSQGKNFSVKQISRALINAHNNGVNLENITLMFSSCHSYTFAGNIINELINNGITVFPQILTDAGKETVYGYTKQIDTDNETIKVSNLFYSLIKSLDSKTHEELEQMKGSLSFKDVADAPRYLSNNTVFATNRQIDELNHSLERIIRDIIEQNEDDDKMGRIYPIMDRDGMYVAADYNKYTQLLLDDTKEILDRIGNTKIIKALYKENAGKNFKNTKLGTTIGTFLIEAIPFWIPNFVEKHNFTPEQTAGAKAVVWRIKALSIGIGLVRIIPLMILSLNPLTAIISPAIIAHFILTTITTANFFHYLYDRKTNSKTEEVLPAQQQYETEFDESKKETEPEETSEEIKENPELKQLFLKIKQFIEDLNLSDEDKALYIKKLTEIYEDDINDTERSFKILFIINNDLTKDKNFALKSINFCFESCFSKKIKILEDIVHSIKDLTQGEENIYIKQIQEIKQYDINHNTEYIQALLEITEDYEKLLKEIDRIFWITQENFYKKDIEQINKKIESVGIGEAQEEEYKEKVKILLLQDLINKGNNRFKLVNISELLDITDSEYMMERINFLFENLKKKSFAAIYKEIDEDRSLSVAEKQEFKDKVSNLTDMRCIVIIAEELNLFIVKKYTSAINYLTFFSSIEDKSILTRIVDEYAADLLTSWLYKNFAEKAAKYIENFTKYYGYRDFFIRNTELTDKIVSKFINLPLDKRTPDNMEEIISNELKNFIMFNGNVIAGQYEYTNLAAQLGLIKDFGHEGDYPYVYVNNQTKDSIFFSKYKELERENLKALSCLANFSETKDLKGLKESLKNMIEILKIFSLKDGKKIEELYEQFFAQENIFLERQTDLHGYNIDSEISLDKLTINDLINIVHQTAISDLQKVLEVEAIELNSGPAQIYNFSKDGKVNPEIKNIIQNISGFVDKFFIMIDDDTIFMSLVYKGHHSASIIIDLSKLSRGIYTNFYESSHLTRAITLSNAFTNIGFDSNINKFLLSARLSLDNDEDISIILKQVCKVYSDAFNFDFVLQDRYDFSERSRFVSNMFLEQQRIGLELVEELSIDPDEGFYTDGTIKYINTKVSLKKNLDEILLQLGLSAIPEDICFKEKRTGLFLVGQTGIDKYFNEPIERAFIDGYLIMDENGILKKNTVYSEFASVRKIFAADKEIQEEYIRQASIIDVLVKQYKSALKLKTKFIIGEDVFQMGYMKLSNGNYLSVAVLKNSTNDMVRYAYAELLTLDGKRISVSLEQMIEILTAEGYTVNSNQRQKSKTEKEMFAKELKKYSAPNINTSAISAKIIGDDTGEIISGRAVFDKKSVTEESVLFKEQLNPDDMTETLTAKGIVVRNLPELSHQGLIIKEKEVPTAIITNLKIKEENGVKFAEITYSRKTGNRKRVNGFVVEQVEEITVVIKENDFVVIDGRNGQIIPFGEDFENAESYVKQQPQTKKFIQSEEKIVLDTDKLSTEKLNFSMNVEDNIKGFDEQADERFFGTKAFNLHDMFLLVRQMRQSLSIDVTVPYGIMVGAGIILSILNNDKNFLTIYKDFEHAIKTGNQKKANIKARELIKFIDGLSEKELSKINSVIERKIDEAVQKGYLTTEDKYAVRSAFIGEDGDKNSSAGVGKSFIGADRNDIVKLLIKSVLKSVYEDRSVAYQLSNKQNFVPAALIQQAVDSDKSAVLMVRDGNLIISGSWGQGEILVSGEKAQSTIEIEFDDKEKMEIISYITERQDYQYGFNGEVKTVPNEKSSRELFSEEEIENLAKIGRYLRENFGYNSDIEIAIKDGTIYVVQIRPIVETGEKVQKKVVQNLIKFFVDKILSFVNLINSLFIKDTNILEEENKIIVVSDTEQQAEQIKEQVTADIAAVSMEIKYTPERYIRGGKLLDVSTGIRAKYDKTKSKLIIYSKQGIEMNEQQIKNIIRDYYYQSRKESYSNHLIIFADSPDDVENKINNERESLILVPIKEIIFDVSARNITDFSAVCTNEEIATGAKTFIVSKEQAEKFKVQIQQLQKAGYKFIISQTAVYKSASDEVRISATDDNMLTEEYLESILENESIRSIIIDDSSKMFVFENKSKLFTHGTVINIEMQYIIADQEKTLQSIRDMLSAA